MTSDLDDPDEEIEDERGDAVPARYARPRSLLPSPSPSIGTLPFALVHGAEWIPRRNT
jgi:hypothetical protein